MSCFQPCLVSSVVRLLTTPPLCRRLSSESSDFGDAGAPLLAGEVGAVPSPSARLPTRSKRRLAGRLIDAFMQDVGGPLGYAITLLLCLGWCVGYPSLLALPILLWAGWRLLHFYSDRHVVGSAADDRFRSSVAFNLLVKLAFAITLVRCCPAARSRAVAGDSSG